MASLLIRQLDDNRSGPLFACAPPPTAAPSEAREIRLPFPLEPARRVNLAQAIRRHVDPLGGIDLVIPPRELLLLIR